MEYIPPARPGAQLVTNSEINPGWTHKFQPLHIASHANYNIEIGFQQRHGGGSCVAGGMNRQIGICDDVSIWNAIPVPIFLRVSFYLISVTKLWDMIIRLCMCKSQIGNANILDFKSHWLMTNDRDIILPVTVQLANWNETLDKTRSQTISLWCPTSHRCSSQWALRSWMNDDHHAPSDHASNCITLGTDLVHMVEMLKNGYGRSWQSRGISWTR